MVVAARQFYSGVFGYETSPLEGTGGDYHLFRLPNEEAPLGGMGPMFGLGGSSHWLVYFSVTDAQAAASAAESSGGHVVSEPQETPFGTMATLTDPAGAVFTIAQAVPGGPQPERAG